MEMFRAGEAFFAAGRFDDARAEFRRFLLLYRQCPIPDVDFDPPDETGVVPATLWVPIESVLAPALLLSRLSLRDPDNCRETIRTFERLTPSGARAPDDTPANVRELWRALAVDAAALEPFSVPPDLSRLSQTMCAVMDRFVRHLRAAGRDDALLVLYVRALGAAGLEPQEKQLKAELERRRFYLADFLSADSRHHPQSLSGALFALGWLRRVDGAIAQAVVDAYNGSLAQMPESRPDDALRWLTLWREMARLTTDWEGPDAASVSGWAAHRADPYLVVQRLRRRDPRSLDRPSFAYFVMQVLVLAGDLDASAIAERLAALKPHSRELAVVLTQALLSLVDWPAASRLAWRAEALRIAARRKVARRGSLLVLFEPMLWSFGDTAARLDLLHHWRRGNRIDWFPLVVDATPEGNPKGIANSCLLDSWEKHFPIVHDSALMRCLRGVADTVEQNDGEYFLASPDRCVDTSQAISESYYDAERAGLPPTLTLSAANAAWGAATLQEKFGVASDAWFVSVHVRGAGWHGDAKTSDKFAKTADPFAYLKALKSVVAAGGVVFRLGDPSMLPLPFIEGVFDIAHSPHKSQRLDVYLCAAARFGIGTCSGPAAVMAAYGVPLVTTNAVPLDSGSLRPGDLYIHKLLRRVDDDSLVPFAQLMVPPLQETRRPYDFIERGYQLVDNSEDEIDGAVREMIALRQGKRPFSTEDEARQARYRALTVSQPRPMGLVGTPSAYFLAKHRALLPA